jgi:hypothetical protein
LGLDSPSHISRSVFAIDCFGSGHGHWGRCRPIPARPFSWKRDSLPKTRLSLGVMGSRAVDHRDSPAMGEGDRRQQGARVIDKTAMALLAGRMLPRPAQPALPPPSTHVPYLAASTPTESEQKCQPHSVAIRQSGYPSLSNRVQPKPPPMEGGVHGYCSLSVLRSAPSRGTTPTRSGTTSRRSQMNLRKSSERPG